ncbi:hypothetical protein ACWDMY_06170, partial [Streptomyces globisporus]
MRASDRFSVPPVISAHAPPVPPVTSGPARPLTVGHFRSAQSEAAAPPHEANPLDPKNIVDLQARVLAEG